MTQVANKIALLSTSWTNINFPGFGPTGRGKSLGE